MKFGVREICDVVLKAKATQKVGNKVFYKNEPVIYFDTLKTSSLEGAATTVYAQGGRGNSRLVAWEGERTVTFTMEDALISPAGFMILSGAGLIEGTSEDPIPVHTIETTDKFEITPANADGTTTTVSGVTIYLAQEPYGVENAKENYCYVMVQKGGEVITEPYIPVKSAATQVAKTASPKGEMESEEDYKARVAESKAYGGLWKITLSTTAPGYTEGSIPANSDNDLNWFLSADAVLVDYYTPKATGAMQIDITPDKFGGNYYLEASTLFRNTDGVDLPAEFIIPNCKIQSNFTFTMASSGDPSTFTFTIDAFPDYTRFNKTKKVLAAIQIIDVASSEVGMNERERPAWSADTVGREPFRKDTWAKEEPAE